MHLNTPLPSSGIISPTAQSDDNVLKYKQIESDNILVEQNLDKDTILETNVLEDRIEKKIDPLNPTIEQDIIIKPKRRKISVFDRF